MKLIVATSLLAVLAGCAGTSSSGPGSVTVTRERSDVVRCELQGYLEPAVSASDDPKYDPIRDLRGRAWHVHRADTLLVTSRHGKLWGETYRCSGS